MVDTTDLKQSDRQLVLDIDPNKIGQVLYNLVSNALKYTSLGGSVTVRVFVSGANDTRHAVVSVQDTGVGLSYVRMPIENAFEYRLE